MPGCAPEAPELPCQVALAIAAAHQLSPVGVVLSPEQLGEVRAKKKRPWASSYALYVRKESVRSEKGEP